MNATQIQLLQRAPAEAPTIQKLSEATINKIAAGEVVVSPSAALKELIENSIDAGSTQVNVLVQGGGIQLLQIQDDGHGVQKESYPLLCERFTTSKITEFADLRKVSSFGFRGEALASISYCSYLTVISKVQDSEVGYTAQFINGKMNTEFPQSVAAQKGTTIQVRDLFYNSKQRRKAIGTNEEYQKIIDLVSRYSVHYPLIKFSCKKVEDKRTDVSTHNVPRPQKLLETQESELEAEQILEEINQVRSEVIRRNYGTAVVGKPGECFTTFKFWEILNVGVNIFATKPNTVQGKKNQLLLFANNRLVESDKIKKVIDDCYSIYQPKGAFNYFVYLALSIRPDLIDVNVHPTKKQVIIDRQNDICELLAELLDQNMTQQAGNRAVAQKHVQQDLFDFVDVQEPSENLPYTHQRTSDLKVAKKNPTQVVRTDAKALTLDKFLQQNQSSTSQQKHELAQNVVVPTQLMPVKKLIYLFQEDFDQQLQKTFKNHSYVGMLSPDQILLQFDTKLVLCQTFLLMQEFLYQQCLVKLQQMSVFKFDPLKISELITLSLEHPDSDYDSTRHQPKQQLTQLYSDRIIANQEELEWFGIRIEQECLVGMPVVVKGFKVFPQELPMFLLRVATIQHKAGDQEWIRCVAEEISFYYARYVDVISTDQKSTDEFKFELEHQILPLMKRQFVARRRMAVNDDLTFTMVTCTENLYKVFERC